MLTKFHKGTITRNSLQCEVVGSWRQPEGPTLEGPTDTLLILCSSEQQWISVQIGTHNRNMGDEARKKQKQRTGEVKIM